ncbi:MAG: amidase family protein, partial [Patescibacteria group bacterium]
VYYILMPAEASTNLARYDGVRFGLHVDGANSIEDYFKTRAAGFGPEVRRRIILGSYVLSAGYYDAYYKKACAVRDLISRDFDRVFSGDGQIAPVHAVLTPTSPTPAFKIGEKSDPLSMYLADIFTVPANIAGVPSISVPTGFALRDGKNLPLGTLITTSRGREDIMFGVGKVISLPRI